MSNDMTKGNPMKLILTFSLPILVGSIFQQFYSMVDSIIVGRVLGEQDLAAIGATGSLSFLVIGWVMGLTGGFGILISQRFGAGDQKGVRHYMAMSLYLCILFAVVMTALMLCVNDSLLKVMNTPPEIIRKTSAYIRVIYAGLTATIAYNMLASILRAVGDSKTPLYFLILSSVINIGLDLLFVASLDMGVAGAAFATVISQGISSVLCFVYMLSKYPMLRIKKEEFAFSAYSIVKMLKTGIPMALQFSITAIGAMMVQVALNGLGSVYIAAYTVSNKIQNIVTQPMPSFGLTMATYTGQNYGAQKYDRVKEGARADFKLILIFGVIAMILVLVFGKTAATLFLPDADTVLLQTVSQYFFTVAWFYPVLGLIFLFRNILQGFGDGLVPMLGGVFELLARAAVVILLSKPFGFAGICWAEPIAWLFALIPLIPVYFIRQKQLNH